MKSNSFIISYNATSYKVFGSSKIYSALTYSLHGGYVFYETSSRRYELKFETSKLAIARLGTSKNQKCQADI